MVPRRVAWQAWFDARWRDRWCLDIADDLIAIIDSSWARPERDAPPPYQIYLKIAYHLSREARAGLSEFRIPRDFGNQLFDFQTAAVKIAAHHLNKRRGVLIGDVVGLGKTLMATALARIFKDDHGLRTLIVCPKNLVPMWEDYADRYDLGARVLSLSSVIRELPNLRRYPLVLIDESHNLRNREGSRYKALREYIQENESRCILLSATPYNKSYLDLSAQLRLFVAEDQDLGVRPEKLLTTLGDTEFARLHQCPPRSLAAFEKSDFPDDWRDLLRLYMVRRTRSFIQQNYAPACRIHGHHCGVVEAIVAPLATSLALAAPGAVRSFPDGEPICPASVEVASARIERNCCATVAPHDMAYGPRIGYTQSVGGRASR